MHNALHKLEALFRLLSPQHIVIADLQKTNEAGQMFRTVH